MLNPLRIVSLIAAAVAGSIYGWRTERHQNVVKLRKPETTTVHTANGLRRHRRAA